MNLTQLLVEYGDPRNSYSDEVVAAFYEDVDDGSYFAEALAEIDDAQRKRVIALLDDQISRTLSHQMVGQILGDQLRRYARNILENHYDQYQGEIRMRREDAAAAHKADLQNDGEQTGCMP